MADAPILSPDVSRSVSVLARTLVAAARSWALYRPDAPDIPDIPDIPDMYDALHSNQVYRDGLPSDRIKSIVSIVGNALFRPQVTLVRNRRGDALEPPMLVNTWEPDGRGDYTWAVVEAVDPDVAGVDPLQYM
jgi:hypothetical protein